MYIYIYIYHTWIILITTGLTREHKECFVTIEII